MRRGTTLLLLMGCALCAVRADATTYTFVDLTAAGFDGASAAGIYNAQVLGSAYTVTGGQITHAGYWPAGPGSFVSLTPSSFYQAGAQGSDGVHQFGYADDSHDHAMLWSGTAASMVDLTPSGYSNSDPGGIYNGREDGTAWNRSGAADSHAMLWSGTAASALDLHPQGYATSAALGIFGSLEVGKATTASGDNHAGMWHDTAASFVDLNPAGYVWSSANAASGNQQVGYGYQQRPLASSHALLWTGSAASVVDLSPAGFGYSAAVATNGVQQVGFGLVTAADGQGHALVWSGTAASVVDLDAYAPAGYVNLQAQGIDGDGTIVGLAAFSTAQGSSFRAVEWIPTPEPSVFAILACGGGGLLVRRRR
jgi:hypothetical protein